MLSPLLFDLLIEPKQARFVAPNRASYGLQPRSLLSDSPQVFFSFVRLLRILTVFLMLA